VRRFESGERSVAALRDGMIEALSAAGLRPDYVTLADPETIEKIAEDRLPERALLALAAFAGTTRLIDNVVLGEGRVIV
jgi:pantothenate synthetase